MTLELVYWIILLVLAVFGVVVPGPQPRTWRDYGGFGVQFVLFLIIGWAVFGAPIK